MLRVLSPMALAALLLATLPLAAQAESLLVVLNKSDHEAVLIEPRTFSIIAKLPTGIGPHEAAASPDGRFVYVANYGTRTPGNTITVIDIPGRRVARTLDLGEYRRPHGIGVSRDGKLLWVTCEANQAVLEINSASGAIARVYQTGQQVSHMVVPTPDERKLYVANIGSGSVTVIERTSGRVKTIPTGAGTEGIDVSPDGREVWVGNRAADSISVIDTATDQVVVTFFSEGQMPIRVKFTPDGKQVWVSNARSNAVASFDAASRQHLTTIGTGSMPVGILLEPGGRRAFVANTQSNQVTVIDVATKSIVHRIAPGTEPDGMTWVR
ncbi:MAG: beta-propeller fold lactonase family protein [Terriglobia bacterium]